MREDERFWRALEPEIPWLHRFLRRMGVAARDLDDVTQNTLMLMHARRADYNAKRPMRPWLAAFATRVAANYRRWRTRDRDAPAPVDDPRETMIDPSLSPEDSASAQDARALVLDALRALDDDQRAVLVMIDIEEFSAPEVARTLVVPLNTVYSRLRLGREAFAQAVARLQARRGDR